MFFNEIIGHGFIKENLISTVQTGKISHAYIFDGAEGIGKEKTAKIFAQSILCENFKDDVCGDCNACHLTFNDSHPDLKVLDLTIGDDGKQKASISVDAVRQLKKDVYLKPFFSKRKIYIIESAEKMTVEAQNALLKIFEEPPSYITLILICNGLSKILPTIKSRAVIYKFPSLKPKELEKYLDKYYNDKDNKKIYANISGGSVSKMIELISDDDSLNYRREIISSFVKLIKDNSETCFNRLFKIFMENKEDKFNIIYRLCVFLFDIAYKKTGNIEKIVNIDFENEIDSLCYIDSDMIYEGEKILATLSEQLTKNANYKLAVINSLIKLSKTLK